MDDVDGALFSRVQITDHGYLDRLFNLSSSSLVDGRSDVGKYSKLSTSKTVPQMIHMNDTAITIKDKHAEEMVIKRESVPVFHSVPPRYRGVERKAAGQKPLDVFPVGSAPCGLDKGDIRKTNRTDSRNECVRLSLDIPLLTGINDQHNEKSIPKDCLITKSSCTNKPVSRPHSHCAELDQIKEEVCKDVYPVKTVSVSNLENKSHSLEDLQSDLDDGLDIDSSALVQEFQLNAVNPLDLDRRPYKEPNDRVVRLSSVFYLNEDEALVDQDRVDINDDRVVNSDNVVDGNEHNVSVSPEIHVVGQEQKQNGVDSTDAQYSNGSAEAVTKNGNGKFEHGDTPESEIMLETDKYTRQKPVLCRVVLALIFPVLSMIIYISDIGSDIRLAIVYKNQGDINLFCITLACIVIPLILMSIVDVSWLWLDRPPTRPSHVIRYVLGACTVGRIVRAFAYMWHVVKGETSKDEQDRIWHKNRATEGKRDCYILDFINAFAESVPQFFVQVYLMYSFNLELTVIRVLNLLSSWASIAWTYSAYYRCNREVMAGKQDLHIVGFTVFFVSVLSSLAARVICVVFFLVYFRTWIGCTVLGVHFIVILFWIIFRENPALEGTASGKLGKYLYCIFFAYVSLLCFLNLRNTRARFRMIAFYLLLYIENFTMAALAFHKMYVSQVEHEKLYNLLALPIGFILHIMFLIIYYKGFHPITGRYR